MARTKPAAPPAATPPASKRVRVMIVDDHELLRNGLAELLDSQPDMQVCGQAAGETEAWGLARKSPPDLAIVDISLAEGDGINLIKRLAQRDPSLRIVVLSSCDETLYAERSLRAGAHGYISKQTPSRQIVDAIRQVLSNSLYLSEQMTERVVRRAAGQRGPAVSPLEMLSDRELRVFTLLGRGIASAQIAEELHISPRTVDTYRERIKSKLNLRTGAELTLAAMQWVLEHS